MLYKFLAVICCCILFNNNANAGLVEWDAFDQGDGLAVKDNSTGLIWLDLSLTAGAHFDDAGTQYSGWEHASYQHVEKLMDYVFPDIVSNGAYGSIFSYEQGCAFSDVLDSCYQTAKDWQDLFGATVGHVYYQTYAYGLYMDENNVLRMAGSFLNGAGSANRYGQEFSVNYSVNYDSKYANDEFANFSSFLLLSSSIPQSAAIEVSEPSTLVLMLGAMLVATRKRRGRPVIHFSKGL